MAAVAVDADSVLVLSGREGWRWMGDGGKSGNLDPCCGACNRRDRRRLGSNNNKMTTLNSLGRCKRCWQCREEVEKQSCAALTKARSGSRCSTVMEPRRRVTLARALDRGGLSA